MNEAQEEAKLVNQLKSIRRKLEEAKQHCIEAKETTEKSAPAVVIYCEKDHDKEGDKPKPPKENADKSAQSSTNKSEASPATATAPAPAPKPKNPIETSVHFDIDKNKFALLTSNTNHSTKKDKKQNEVKAIESRNANNGRVILAGWNMPYNDMPQAVDNIDVKTMVPERKPGIREYIPTKEQQKQVLPKYMIQSDVYWNDTFEQLYSMTGEAALTLIIALDSGSSTISFKSRQQLPRGIYLSIKQESLHTILEAVLNIFIRVPLFFLNRDPDVTHVDNTVFSSPSSYKGTMKTNTPSNCDENSRVHGLSICDQASKFAGSQTSPLPCTGTSVIIY